MAQQSQSHPILSTPSGELKSHVARSYDAVAAKYNVWSAAHDPIRLEYLNQLIPLLPKSGNLKILEIGCGPGGAATKLLASHAHVVANDISATQIQLAREALKDEVAAGKVELRQGDMMELEFGDGELDAVVGFYSILHLPRTEQAEMLRRAGRWLKPGGWLLVNFDGGDVEGKIEEGWLEEEGGKKEGESGNIMFWSSWGADATQKLVKEAGFKAKIAEVASKEGLDAEFLWILAEKVAA